MSADHVFFDADSNAHILEAGAPVLEYQSTLRRATTGGFVLETRVVALVGMTLRPLWTIGKLVAWERA